MAGTLHVVAILQAQEGKEEELQALLQGLVEPTRAEPGCLAYHLHVSTEEPGEFVFVEEWQDAASLEGHFGTPHIQAAIAAFPGVLAADLDLRTLLRVD